MLIIGHEYIKFEPLYHIESRAAVLNTPSNSTILITFKKENLDLVTYAQDNFLAFALEISSLQEIIFAHNLGTKYILTPKHLLIQAQKVAENYLFDAKILTIIESDDEIENFALEGIDGVIFSDAIIKICSTSLE